MSANLIEQFYKLELITNTKSLKARKLLLSEFSRDVKFCKAVREVVKNTKNQKLKLSDKQKQKINKYKKLLHSILEKTSPKKRQKLMCQSGTGIFLPIVVPLVATLLSHLLSKDAVH